MNGQSLYYPPSSSSIGDLWSSPYVPPSGREDGESGPLSVTNVQKRSLDPATAVGTQVAVSDGFWMSDDPANDNGFYYENGEVVNGKPKCVHYPTNTDMDITWDGTDWRNTNGSYSNSDVAHFWLATDNAVDHGGYILTHPALQQLNAASTAQGGVFVAGGTQDGVYTTRGTSTGKDYFGFLGQASDANAYSVAWTTALENYLSIFGSGWIIKDPGGDNALYYSLSDTLTPDLADNWKNASDDSPASITVSSVTVGQLNAGLRIGEDTFIVNGSENGRNKYSDVLGVETDLTWTLDGGGKWYSVSMGGNINLGNIAFPFLGTPEVAVTRSDVAAEANWGAIP